MACYGQEPFCSCRLVRPMDRPCAWPPTAPRHRFDMDSSVSPTHGEQENSVWNGHYACNHPLFVFNQFGDLECCALRPAMSTALTAGRMCSTRSCNAIEARSRASIFQPMQPSPCRGLRVSRSGADQVCDPAAGQPGSAEQDRLSAQASGRTTGAPCAPEASGSGGLRPKIQLMPMKWEQVLGSSGSGRIPAQFA